VSYVDLLQVQRDAVQARRALADGRRIAAEARWKLLGALGERTTN
jgi:outer membrane protein TolC